LVSVLAAGTHTVRGARVDGSIQLRGHVSMLPT
jgi:hypothetical protein